MSVKLFYYGKCEVCKSIKNDVRVALSHIFAPHLCEQISDYNVYCRGCRTARYYENDLIKRGMDLGWCKMEMVMAYFCLHKPDTFDRGAPKTVRVNAMNQWIDEYISEDRVKKMLKRYFK